jgi:hypothetical protein
MLDAMSDDEGEHVRRSWVIENQWKCRSCGGESAGRDIVCRECGAARDQKQEDLDADAQAAPEVTDEKLLRYAEAGAHWVCGFCGSQQREVGDKCTNCGGERGKGRSLADAPASVDDDTPAPPKRGRWIALAVASVVGAGGGGAAWMLVPHEVQATVSRMAWTYTASLERKTLAHRSGWGSPGGAFNVHCQRRQSGTEQCNPYTCGTTTESYACGSYDCNCRQRTTKLKNGFSKVEEVCSTCTKQCQRQVPKTCYHECPVYRDWCSYDVYEWPVVETKQTSGDSAVTTWPVLTANGPDEQVSKNERYEVEFLRGGKRYKWTPPDLASFARFRKDAAWVIKVTGAGDVEPVAAR